MPAASAESGSQNSGTANKTAAHTTTHHKPRYRRRSSRRRGQQKIDAERTLQIQNALIEQHYLTGKPSGKWDHATQDALEHYQSDNGWQTKVVPDSRALIKLGLGPDQEHLLNPETAMTSTPVKEANGAESGKTDPAPAKPAPASHPAAAQRVSSQADHSAEDSGGSEKAPPKK